MTYGKRLEAALTHAGRTRKELALHIEQSPQSIGMVITGKNEKLSTDASVKAAAFLRVDHNWLVSGRGSMTPIAGPPLIAPKLSPEGQRLGEWLDKIKDPELHYRTAHAAMAVILRVVDGPQTETTPEQQPKTEKQRGERSGR